MSNILLSVKRNKSVVQLFRYAFVGITTNFAGYMVYLLITYLGGTPKLTMTFLYGFGVMAGFFGNRQLTFVHEGSLIGAGVRYVIAHCFGYFINLTILFILVDKLGYSHQWVQAAAIFIVAAFLFPVFKYFVFKEQDFSDAQKK